MDHGKFSQANEVLDQAMSGFFSTEPNLMLLRAKSRFENGDYAAAVTVLDSLQEANPDFRSAEGHLLYSRALEASGRPEEALEEYRSVARYFPGVEARYRLAMALHAAGRGSESLEELEQLINDARLAPAHFRKSQKKWLKRAREQLLELQGK